MTTQNMRDSESIATQLQGEPLVRSENTRGRNLSRAPRQNDADFELTKEMLNILGLPDWLPIFKRHKLEDSRFLVDENRNFRNSENVEEVLAEYEIPHWVIEAIQEYIRLQTNPFGA